MKDLLPIALGSVLMASCFASAAENYRDVVLADKPFAYYRLGESTNKEPVADEVGKNAGSYVNEPDPGMPGAILTEPENTAVRMARLLNQYVKLTPLGTYGSQISSGFSVEYWLKTANSTEHQNILGTANSPTYITDFQIDIAYEGTPGKLRLYCRDDHANRFNVEFLPEGQNIKIYDLQWHHMVHVYDPKASDANDQFRLYIDGERQEVTSWRKNAVPEFSAFNDPMTLGAMDLRGDYSDSLDGSLDEVAFYTAPLSAEQVVKHYRAAGYKEHERAPEAPKPGHRDFGFPAPTPVKNANPGVRHEVIVEVPTKLTFERNPDQLIARADLAETKKEKMTVGENMITGMEFRFVAYPKGEAAPADPDGFGMTSSTEFTNAHHYFNRQLGGMPEAGKAYVVEMRWKIFETDVPPQHFWSPQGKKYKVILEGTIRQESE